MRTVGRLALLIAVVIGVCLAGRPDAGEARFAHNGVITFVSTTDFEASLRQVIPGQNPGFIAPPDFKVSWYSWAPDGAHIAYAATLANTLYVQNGGMQHIADHVGTGTWSPDSTHLAYTDETGKTLSVTDSTGSTIDPVVSGSGVKNPAWSPLGDAIVFEAGGALKSTTPDGGSVITLSGSQGLKSPQWSPFGDRVAALNSTNTVVVLAPHGPVITTLSATKGTDGFSWSPDGTMIAFNHSAAGGERIFVVASGGGDATPVSSVAHTVGPPAWSPDGGEIAYPRADAGKNADIWMVAPDAQGEQQVTDTEVLDDAYVGWQPLHATIGDGDCNGDITLTDLAALLHYAAGLSSIGGCLLAMNVNCGDSLDAADVVPMLQYLAHLPVSVPKGCSAIGS